MAMETLKERPMQTSHFKAGNTQIVEVEIYETGEKTQIAATKQIAKKKNNLDRSIIITAAEYASYKADIM
jgi:hypothetical protein